MKKLEFNVNNFNGEKVGSGLIISERTTVDFNKVLK